MARGVLHIIGKLLKHGCLKWAHLKWAQNDPFRHLKHKLWPKEGLGVKLAVCLPTTKS